MKIRIGKAVDPENCNEQTWTEIDVNAAHDVELTEIYNGVGIVTDLGRFGIAMRDGGIEVMLNGKLMWSSSDYEDEMVFSPGHEGSECQCVSNNNEGSTDCLDLNWVPKQGELINGPHGIYIHSGSVDEDGSLLARRVRIIEPCCISDWSSMDGKRRGRAKNHPFAEAPEKKECLEKVKSDTETEAWREENIQIDYFRCLGEGVDVEPRYVRITHSPTGLIVDSKEDVTRRENLALARKMMNERLEIRRRDKDNE